MNLDGVPEEVEEEETVPEGTVWCPELLALVDAKDRRRECEPCGEEERDEANAYWKEQS